MYRNFKYTLSKTFLVTSILGSIATSNSYAVNINPEVTNIGYWYDDDDIRNIITNRLGDKVYIAPAVPNVPALIKDVAEAAIFEARSGKPALIPVNLNGNHWTSIAIRAKNNGDIIVFYNDSFGSSIGGIGSESGQYIAAIKQILPNAQIIDLQVHQQNDGSSCGVFTAENLIALGLLDDVDLTPEAAKALLGAIRDGRGIRLLHLNDLGTLYQKIVTREEVENNAIIRSNIENTAALTFTEIANLSSLTKDRLSHLYLVDLDSTGLSAGDDDSLNYGVWAGGSLGVGVIGAKDSAKVKQNCRGVTIGFDGKIDEDTILGIAIGSSISTLKPKSLNFSTATNNHTKFSTDVKSIVGSIYGSMQVDERLVITGSFELGKLYGKTKYRPITSDNNFFKLKGDLFGANIAAGYYAPLGSLTLVPNLGASYRGVKLAGNKQNNLSISKTDIQKLSITPALSVLTVLELGNLQLIPEISASYSNNLSLKSKKLTVKNAQGKILSNDKISIAKHSYNLGASLTLASSRIEASLGYERMTQSKYLGHTGYLKLRINI